MSRHMAAADIAAAGFADARASTVHMLLVRRRLRTLLTDWGKRRMVERLTRDRARMQQTVAVFATIRTPVR